MKRIAMKTVEYLPDFPFEISRFHKPEIVSKEETYDSLEMTMTLFDFDGEYACWIGMDLGRSSIVLKNIIQKALDHVTNRIKPDHLYVSVTHTHSGPNYTAFLPQKGTQETEEELHPIAYHIANKAMELFIDCESRLAPFVSDIKVTEIEGCYSNRNDVNKPCDKNITLIRFQNEQTKATIGMWMNMACHSTMIFPRNEKMSADVIGNVAKAIGKHYQTHVMPLAGCQGDTSTRLTRRRGKNAQDDLTDMHRIVNEITKQVLNVSEDFNSILIDRFIVKSFELSYHYHIDPEQTSRTIERVREELKTETRPEFIHIKNDTIGSLQNKVGICDFQGLVPGFAINMGEIKWGIFPGELVASLGLQIVKHEPHDHRLVACYTNYSVGYLVEKEEYGKNFESLVSSIPEGVPEVITTMMLNEINQFEL